MGSLSNVELSSELFVNEDKIHSRLHAKYLDKYFGYKISKIEVKLLQKFRAYDRVNDDSNKKQHYKGTQTWIGLHPQVLQTPYCDIYKALMLLKDIVIEHVVDIGAGYGRVGIVLNALYPEARFTGFEIVKQRQQEGNRIYSNLLLDNCNIENKNVLDSDFELPQAEVYFIYDFSRKEDLYQIMKTLSKRVKKYRFYLIVRGDQIVYLMKNNFKHIWSNCIHLESSDLRVYCSSCS